MDCPHCKVEINSSATRCPHCSGEIVHKSNFSTPKAMLMAACVAAVVIFLALYFWLNVSATWSLIIALVIGIGTGFGSTAQTK